MQTPPHLPSLLSPPPSPLAPPLPLCFALLFLACLALLPLLFYLLFLFSRSARRWLVLVDFRVSCASYGCFCVVPCCVICVVVVADHWVCVWCASGRLPFVALCRSAAASVRPSIPSIRPLPRAVRPWSCTPSVSPPLTNLQASTPHTAANSC